MYFYSDSWRWSSQSCIFCRREYGYCKIGWRQTSDTDSFKMSRPATSYNSATGPGQCDTDGAIIIGQWSLFPRGPRNDHIFRRKQPGHFNSLWQPHRIRFPQHGQILRRSPQLQTQCQGDIQCSIFILIDLFCRHLPKSWVPDDPSQWEWSLTHQSLQPGIIEASICYTDSINLVSCYLSIWLRYLNILSG